MRIPLLLPKGSKRRVLLYWARTLVHAEVALEFLLSRNADLDVRIVARREFNKMSMARILYAVGARNIIIKDTLEATQGREPYLVASAEKPE